MHEMSIALNIIDIATEAAANANSKKINGIEIEIGSISGVEIDALEFALEVAVQDTMLANSSRKIIPIEAKAECLECHNTFPVSFFYEPCPSCYAININILQGKELRIKSINVE